MLYCFETMWWVKFWCFNWKASKTSIFPPVKILCYTVATELWIKEHTKFTKVNSTEITNHTSNACTENLAIYNYMQLNSVILRHRDEIIKLNAMLCIVSECIVLPYIAICDWILIKRDFIGEHGYSTKNM